MTVVTREQRISIISGRKARVMLESSVEYLVALMYIAVTLKGVPMPGLGR